QIVAAPVSASIPVDTVGSMTGANMGEWFDGRSRDRAAISPIVVAPSKPAGSAPPSSQYTQGAPAALASRPTSSLPVTGPGSMMAGDTDCKAGRVRAQAALSLMTAGNDSASSTSGGLGAPAVAASPRAI